MTLQQDASITLARNIWEQQRAVSQAEVGEPRETLRGEFSARLRTLQNESAERALLRMLHSPNQLKEKMTWFWMNHFNISIRKSGPMRALLPDYEDTIVRRHAMGRFEDLLLGTVKHPAMLIYLDNTQNAKGRINENFGRELLELHTLGAEGGYSQADVTAMSRILTGLGVRYETEPRQVPAQHAEGYVHDGVFEFHPARHDDGDKTLLGQTITGGGLDEVDAAVRLLARHPATARHISHKLAVYFVSDSPPEALVTATADTFTQTDGDIAAVLRTLLTHPEFQAALQDDDFKDPLRYVVAAVRLMHGEGPPVVNAAPMIQWLNQLGMPLHARDTPDGYPLARSAWQGSGQMAARFNVARAIAAGNPALFQVDKPSADEKRPAPQAARDWYEEGPIEHLSPATRAALDQAQSTYEWNALLLSSPDFMSR